MNTTNKILEPKAADWKLQKKNRSWIEYGLRVADEPEAETLEQAREAGKPVG